MIRSRNLTVLSLVCLFSLLLAGLTGCGQATQMPQPTPTLPEAAPPTAVQPAPTPAVEQPAPKSVVIVIPEDPPSFNAILSDTGYDALVMELTMLGLTDIDPQGNVLPELAAELPTVDNGGVVVDEEAGTMEVTWKLRQDVQWQDGKPVTADDVVFTWNAIADPETGTWMQGIDYIGGVAKVDDYTFVISYTRHLSRLPDPARRRAARHLAGPLLRCGAGFHRLGLRPHAVERRTLHPRGVGRRRPHDL